MFENLRAFIAVNLDIVSTRRVIAMQRQLRLHLAEESLCWNWTRPEHLHIAIQDLGRIDQVLVSAISDNLRQLVAALAPVTLQFGRVVAYPEDTRARLLLFEPKVASSTMEPIVGGVYQAMETLGIKTREHPFHPVLIIARSEQPIDAHPVIQSTASTLSCVAVVTELTVYHVPESPEAAEYPALARIALMQPRRAQRALGPRALYAPRNRQPVRMQPVGSAAQSPGNRTDREV